MFFACQFSTRDCRGVLEGSSTGEYWRVGECGAGPTTYFRRILSRRSTNELALPWQKTIMFCLPIACEAVGRNTSNTAMISDTVYPSTTYKTSMFVEKKREKHRITFWSLSTRWASHLGSPLGRTLIFYLYWRKNYFFLFLTTGQAATPKTLLQNCIQERDI